jgi:hypothetical protein
MVVQLVKKLTEIVVTRGVIRANDWALSLIYMIQTYTFTAYFLKTHFNIIISSLSTCLE